MFPRPLYALLFAFLVEAPAAYAFGAQQQSFHETSPFKSGQVKSVLEREPVKVPACKQFVRPFAVLVFLAVLIRLDAYSPLVR